MNLFNSYRVTNQVFLYAGCVEMVCFLGFVLLLSDPRKRLFVKISIHILYFASKYNFQSIRGCCNLVPCTRLSVLHYLCRAICLAFAVNIRLTVLRGYASLPHCYGVLAFSTITSSLQRDLVPHYSFKILTFCMKLPSALQHYIFL